MRTRKLKIRGTKWDIVLLESSETHPELNPEIEHAVTLKEERAIIFSPTGANLNTARHELFHAYCNELYLTSTHEITVGDLEEIIAEMLGEHLGTLNRQANLVTRWFKT
jgi:hypothetical protein